MTIAEAAKKYGMTADTLRYYERVGLLPAVRRTAGGVRDYDDEACNWIEFIKCMRGAGLPIEMLIEYVSLFRRGDETIGSRKALLIEQRDILQARITEMQQTLDRLNRKIDIYEQQLVTREKELLGNNKE